MTTEQLQEIEDMENTQTRPKQEQEILEISTDNTENISRHEQQHIVTEGVPNVTGMNLTRNEIENAEEAEINFDLDILQKLKINYENTEVIRRELPSPNLKNMSRQKLLKVSNTVNNASNIFLQKTLQKLII